MNAKELVAELFKGREIVIVPDKAHEQYNSAIFYANAKGEICCWSRDLMDVVKWEKGKDAFRQHLEQMEWEGHYIFARGCPKGL